MCLIALSASGFKELPHTFWEQACRANPHGLGLMYHAQGALQVRRWLAYDAAFLQDRLLECPADVRIAVHLREATTGDRGECNLHPHMANFTSSDLELAVMHNGGLRRLPAKPSSGPSDTALFAQQWLPRQVAGGPDRWHTPEILKAIEVFAGERNRFVLLDNRGTWRVVGAHEGFEVGDTWLSNPEPVPGLTSPPTPNSAGFEPTQFRSSATPVLQDKAPA